MPPRSSVNSASADPAKHYVASTLLTTVRSESFVDKIMSGQGAVSPHLVDRMKRELRDKLQNHLSWKLGVLGEKMISQRQLDIEVRAAVKIYGGLPTGPLPGIIMRVLLDSPDQPKPESEATETRVTKKFVSIM